MNEGMARLNSVMHDSARRFKVLPFPAKILFFLSLVVSLLVYGLIFRYLARRDVTDEKFIQAETCPACFGFSGCGLIYRKQIQLAGWSNYRVADIVNTKNIRYGTIIPGDQSVVLKKLGSEHEIEELDNKVCRDAKRPDGCDVPRVFFRTDLSAVLRKEPLQPKHLLQSVGMFTCASYRLMDRMWTYYSEARKKKEGIMLGDQLQVWYTASLNPEPLMLQTFPAREQWPFPEYFGACGRHIIVDHVGRTLVEFYNEPFEKRAGIAYEFLKIADHFTNNNEDFALYLTDLSWENFGVDPAGKVRILDAENIIVVDKLAVESKKPRDYDKFLQSQHHDCEGSTCLAFVSEELCSRLHTDHNYYAICKNILDPLLDDSEFPGGLLHDMSEEAKDFWDLEHQLKECARPTKYKGRIFAKEKLLTALRNLHDQTEEHLKKPVIDHRSVRKYKKENDLDYEDYETEEGKDGREKKEVKDGHDNDFHIDDGDIKKKRKPEEERGKDAVVFE